MGVGTLEAVQEEEGSLEEARKSLLLLREKQRSQARVAFAWKTRFKHENRSLVKLKKEREEYLQTIQNQLYVFESLIRRTKAEVENLVKHKDDIIKKQNQLICSMAVALVRRNGHEDLMKLLPGIKIEESSLDLPNKTADESDTKRSTSEDDDEVSEKVTKKEAIIIASSKTDTESLNDSDSAIMMEDAYDSLIVLPSDKGEVKIMRSVSDALELLSRGSHSSTGKSMDNNLRKSSHRSISSTSSEESDGSPASTLNKVASEASEPKSNITISNEMILLPAYPTSNYLLATNSSVGLSYSRMRTGLGSQVASSLSTTRSASPSEIEIASPKIDYQPDYDSDTTLSDGESENDVKSAGYYVEKVYGLSNRTLFGLYRPESSFDSSIIPIKTPKTYITQVTYNRVMSNHRSVTKPKDVKYKRINKAKSRSLEELRGKLKIWDESACISLALGQSEA